MKQTTGRCRAAITLAALAALAAGRPARAAQDVPPPPPAVAAPNPDLQRRIDQMQLQLDALKRESGTRMVPASQPTALPPVDRPSGVMEAAGQQPQTPPPVVAGPTLRQVFVENKPLAISPDASVGYDKGFYIKQGDAFSLKASGVFDVRYSYTDVQNKTALTNTPLGNNRQGSISGFNLYNGQLTLDGELFRNGQSKALFKATGNFGTLQTPVGTTGGVFFVNELYGGYQFNEALKFRAGAMIVPLTPFLGLTLNGGLTLPNIANELPVFLPGFGLGADVGGSLFKDTVSYDLMVNNGSISQGITNATGVLSGSDNRVGVYTREQWCLAGKLNDFLDESDLRPGPQELALQVGGGFGFESQNSSADAFPGPQTSLRILGLSSANGIGFRPAYVVDGEVFRTVLDVRAKYKGFSFVGEGQYQHIRTNDGVPFIPGYDQYSIGQTGFSAQAAYFVVPKHLEVAGRFAQLYTNGLPHHMDEFTFGVNYYLYGQNLKLQLAETYVPRQAALTSGTGLVVNTQDWLTQAQVQLKF